jgi:hypothetical protein
MNNLTFTLSELTLDDVNVILAALQEVPAKICNPLSQKIRAQAEAQVPRPVTPSEPETPEV